MTAATEIAFMTLEIPMTFSLRFEERRVYATGPYSLLYSPRLVRTINHLPEGYATAEPGRADFYDALKVAAVMSAAEGKIITPSDSNEAHQIYVQKSPGAEKLQDVPEFRDHFGNNDEGWHAWEETLTGLRFRKADLLRPYKIGDKVTTEVIVTDITPYLSQIADPKFTRDDFRAIIGGMNRIVATTDVPYAREEVVEEMDPVLGIWNRIKMTAEHDTPYALHAWLRRIMDIPKDPISGHYDVAVGRRSYWFHDEDRCLDVDASYGRWDADSGVSFRPVVRGSGPEIEEFRLVKE